MFRTDGKRADGLILTPWSRGKSLVWDATCVDTLYKSYVPSTAKNSGAAAAKAEKKKTDLYAQLPSLLSRLNSQLLCRRPIPSQYQFVPIAIETLGTGTNRGSRPEVHPRAGRTTPSKHGRTTGDDLANSADQSCHSTRECSQRISNHPPKLRLLSNL